MADRPSFPDAFVDRMGCLVDDVEALLSCLSKPRAPSFRVNTLKADPKRVVGRWRDRGIALEPVPWAPDAYTVRSGEGEVGRTLAQYMGWIHVQSATSMLPPIAVRDELDGARVLDGCAAPGSKTTQCAARMDNGGTIVANDPNHGRLAALAHNLGRLGVENTVVTQRDLRHVGWDAGYDVVLVDAPCSSTGILRKTWSPLERWSVDRLDGLAGLQSALVRRAFDLVRPGGVLVYSTCTFAPEENEAVLDNLLANREAEVHPVSFDGLTTRPGVPSWDGRSFDPAVEDAVRVWPHDNDTDGFFLAKVRKP